MWVQWEFGQAIHNDFKVHMDLGLHTILKSGPTRRQK